MGSVTERADLKKVKIVVVPGLFWHLHFLQGYSHPCQHQLSPFSLWVPSLPSKKGREEKKKLFLLISYHQDTVCFIKYKTNAPPIDKENQIVVFNIQNLSGANNRIKQLKHLGVLIPKCRICCKLKTEVLVKDQP